MSEMQTIVTDSYDRRTIWLHWATAASVVTLWVIGRLNGFLPKGPLRLDIWSIHVLLGFALTAVIVTRIVWRLTHGRKLPPAERGARHVLAELTHAGLYFLVVGVVGLGLLNVLAHGFPLFNLWSFPKIGEKGYAHIVNGWHDLFANILAAVVLFHALAALFHRHVLKDRVLHRMWPARS